MTTRDHCSLAATDVPGKNPVSSQQANRPPQMGAAPVRPQPLPPAHTLTQPPILDPNLLDRHPRLPATMAQPLAQQQSFQSHPPACATTPAFDLFGIVDDEYMTPPDLKVVLEATIDHPSRHQPNVLSWGLVCQRQQRPLMNMSKPKKHRKRLKRIPEKVVWGF